MKDSSAPLAPAADSVPRLLSVRTVAGITGLCVSQIYKLVARGDFPKPLRVTARTTRWRADDVANWINSRPVGTTLSPNPRAARPATA